MEVFVVFGRFRWRGGFDCFREVSVEGRFWLFSGGFGGGKVLVVFGRIRWRGGFGCFREVSVEVLVIFFRFRWRFWLFSGGFGGGFGYFRQVSMEVLVIFGRFRYKQVPLYCSAVIPSFCKISNYVSARKF